jgi:hypothetical protein
MHCSSSYPPNLSFIITQEKWILERKYSKTLREENGRNGIMERERNENKLA